MGEVHGWDEEKDTLEGEGYARRAEHAVWRVRAGAWTGHLQRIALVVIVQQLVGLEALARRRHEAH
eukprot:7387620-Prymnesium_polylepis.1